MIGFLFSRFGAYALAIVIAVGGYQYWKVHQRNIGKAEVVQQSQEDGRVKDGQAKANRTRVDSDDKYFQRKLLEYCRDCKGQTVRSK